MEYTDNEKQILDLIKRTDFKNLSKNDFVSYASKLSELRPEVATQVIAQYPELADLIKSMLTEYRSILNSVISSDDSSLNQVYEILRKEMDSVATSRAEYISFAEKVHADCSKCLDNPDMSPEQKREILDREIAILRMMDQKDTELRAEEREIFQTADKKDSEKRMFNWKLITAASTAVLIAVGIGTSMLAGKLDIKLPTKK